MYAQFKTQTCKNVWCLCVRACVRACVRVLMGRGCKYLLYRSAMFPWMANFQMTPCMAYHFIQLVLHRWLYLRTWSFR